MECMVSFGATYTRIELSGWWVCGCVIIIIIIIIKETPKRNQG